MVELTNDSVRFKRSELLMGTSSLGLLAATMYAFPSCMTGAMHLGTYAGSFALAGVSYWARNRFGSYPPRAACLFLSMFFLSFPLPFAVLTMEGITLAGLYWAVPFAILLAGAAYYMFGSRVALSLVGAKDIAFNDHPVLYRLAEEFSGSIGISMPRLAYIEGAQAKAFSIAGMENAIVLSVGALEWLGEEELREVLEHEFTHLKRKDSVLKAFAYTMSALTPTGFLNRPLLQALVKEQEHT